MSWPARIGIAVLGVLLVVGGGYLVLRYMEAQRAEEAISAYNAALSEAVFELQPELLADVTDYREKGRVTNYITLLWGEGVSMEATLLEQHVSDVRSTDPTVTAQSRETWRYQRRDAESGEAVGEETIETQTLSYTLLVREDGKLVVHLSEIVAETAQ